MNPLSDACPGLSIDDQEDVALGSFEQLRESWDRLGFSKLSHFANLSCSQTYIFTRRCFFHSYQISPVAL